MVERRFARAVGSLDAMFEFISEFVETQGLDPELRYELGLIAEELFTNLVRHGSATGQPVRIALERTPGEVRMILQDFDVEPFDVTRVEPVDVTVPLRERRRGGLGIHLVRRLSDHLHYAYDDRISTITVTKRVGS